jgi:hypothetical protein
VVYRAHDLRNDREVALKLLRVEYARPKSQERFRQETEILARLHHPNIVAYYDSGEFNGAPWYAMSYVEGESLKDRIDREGQLPIGESLRIAKEVADALAHAHAAGVVHRDITPGNILLQGDRVFVADFGIARALDRGAREQWISTSGVTIGTAPYMSPEQGGAEKKIDGRSDIYSLGCVLYEMIGGLPPFSGPSATATVARHILDPVPPIETLRSSVPKAVAEVVYRALAKSPADRFKSAADFSKALEAVALDPATSVVAPSYPRLRRAAIGAVAGAVLAAVVWTAWVAGARVIDARAVAAADTVRLVVFPFAHDSGVAATLDADRLMRQGLMRWRGVEVVDPFALAEAMGTRTDGAVSASHARALALRFHAGRYIRGSLSVDGALLRLHAMLFDVAKGETPIAEASAMAPATGAALVAAYAGVVDRLLLRPTDSTALAASTTGTSNLAARQAFLRGQLELEHWDLPAADSSFAAAARLDQHYAQASLWLALSRLWAEKDTSTWQYAAEAAASGRQQLTASDQAMVDAVSTLAHGDRPRACALWDALARREPFSFSAWYGAADCLVQDQVVLADRTSPSGWRFRSGYHSALARYRRAFELRPAVLRALRADAFGGARELLSTSGTNMRDGFTEGSHAQYFAAYPSWGADTLCFVPFPYSVIGSSNPDSLRRLPRTVGIAVQHQRLLFRDIAAGWAASEPRSADAVHALALSLFLLGEPSAIDTLMHAKALATGPIERQRVVATEIWMRVQFALPGDIRALRMARRLADSLLRTRSADPVDPKILASIAALTGHAFEAAELDRRAPHSMQAASLRSVKSASRTLEIFAAFGGPGDTLRALGNRVDSLITVLSRSDQRDAARADALSRAAVLAFPETAMDAIPTFDARGSYLLQADAAFLRKDTARVRRILADLRDEREAFALPELTLDALYPESWLLASMGDADAAARWLDPTLLRLRLSSSLVDPIRAAMLVRAMAFRAELAARSGDKRTAAEWAAAVVELWANADDFLQPTVRRMRALEQ